MLVSELMQRDIVTATEDESLSDAQDKIKRNGIKHLPVVNDGAELIGIVSDRDIKEASASKATDLEVHELKYLLDKVKLSTIMTRDPITGRADMSVEEAAKTMYDNRIGCVLIAHDNKLTGIVSVTDMLRFIFETR